MFNSFFKLDTYILTILKAYILGKQKMKYKKIFYRLNKRPIRSRIYHKYK